MSEPVVRTNLNAPPPEETENEAGLWVILKSLFPASIRRSSSPTLTVGTVLGAGVPLAGSLWGLIGQSWFGLAEAGVQKVLLFIAIFELITLALILIPIFRVAGGPNSDVRLHNSEAQAAAEGAIRSLEEIVFSWIALYLLFATDITLHLFGRIPTGSYLPAWQW